MKLPNITNKEKEIINYLYSFRFLHTNHFQKLFNHTDKTTVKAWLKDLREKGYITVIDNEKNAYEKRTTPWIYCLTIKSRHLLQVSGNCDPSILKKISREKKRKPRFVNRCLSIADMYLFFTTQKEENQVLAFFTEVELRTYEYFPKVLPAAYISLMTDGEEERYFLEVFAPYTPAFEIRNRVKAYLHYVNSGKWQTHTNNQAFPSVLFVCPSISLKFHIYFYTKALFEKSFEENFNLYLTTWEVLKSGGENIWEKVSIDTPRR